MPQMPRWTSLAHMLLIRAAETRTSPLQLSVALVALLMAAALVGCQDDTVSPDRHSGDCWMMVDTLLATGISVRDTAGVRRAFELYAACADSGGCRSAFGKPKHVRYLSSSPYWKWMSRQYWSVDHMELKPECGGWIPQRYLYVDENGVVVGPMGCI